MSLYYERQKEVRSFVRTATLSAYEITSESKGVFPKRKIFSSISTDFINVSPLVPHAGLAVYESGDSSRLSRVLSYIQVLYLRHIIIRPYLHKCSFVASPLAERIFEMMFQIKKFSQFLIVVLPQLGLVIIVVLLFMLFCEYRCRG